MVAALAFALLPLALAQSAQPATTAAGSVTQAVVAGGASTSLSIGSIQATPTGLGPQGFTIPYVLILDAVQTARGSSSPYSVHAVHISQQLSADNQGPSRPSPLARLQTPL